MDLETIQIQAPGAVLELSGDPLGGLEVSGGASSDFWCDWAEIFDEVGAKMGRRKMGQAGSKLRLKWTAIALKKMIMLGSVWEL